MKLYVNILTSRKIQHFLVVLVMCLRVCPYSETLTIYGVDTLTEFTFEENREEFCNDALYPERMMGEPQI